MYIIDAYLPTRVVFGCGRLEELKNMKLPGRKALICTSSGGQLRRTGVIDRVGGLLKEAGVSCVWFDQVEPNPTKACVEAGVALGRKEACDFVIGLGGGSSIDVAKAVAVMMVSEGDLWDYGYTGTGKRKEITNALPVVAVATTCGTGTECDQYCVITNEETGEKLDFTAEAAFPVISVIDPELMLSLPRNLTIFQGFDALFHCAECYVSNGHKNRFVDLYASEGVKCVAQNLTKTVNDPSDKTARSNLAYAANILGGYCMGLVGVTSHHILGQTLGGMYPSFPHGATLISVAESYYRRVCAYLPDEFDELGEMMGQPRDPQKPGFAFVKALTELMDKNGVRQMRMSDYGVSENDFEKIVDMTVNQVGIDLDRYVLTEADFIHILEESYR